MPGVIAERVPRVAASSAVPRDELEKIWQTQPGIAGWLSSVDHKEIGLRYIVTAFAFLLLGELRRW